MVPHCHASRPQMAEQRSRRPCRHCQPRALGLGDAGQHATSSKSHGRARGTVVRKSTGQQLSRHRWLRQPRVWNRVGIFRILGVLDRHGIKPTLALDKAIADHYPFLIKEGQKRDAEFIAHGLHAARSSTSACPKMRSDSTSAHRSRRSKGHRKTPDRLVRAGFPGNTKHPQSPAAEGIRYVCDWGNDEQPYRMTPKTGELFSLGVNAYLDDNYIHLDGRRTINEVNLLWRDRFYGLYTDGATTGRMMVLHLHPGSWVSRGESNTSMKCLTISAHTRVSGRRPAARSSTGSGQPGQA